MGELHARKEEPPNGLFLRISPLTQSPPPPVPRLNHGRGRLKRRDGERLKTGVSWTLQGPCKWEANSTLDQICLTFHTPLTTLIATAFIPRFLDVTAKNHLGRPRQQTGEKKKLKTKVFFPINPSFSVSVRPFLGIRRRNLWWPW